MKIVEWTDIKVLSMQKFLYYLIKRDVDDDKNKTYDRELIWTTGFLLVKSTPNSQSLNRVIWLTH